MIKEGNSSNFDELINNDLVLVDFFAPWCGPCRMQGPILDEIAEDRNQFSIVKVNVDENNELARKYNVMSIPTLIVFKNGEVVESRTGFMPKELLIEWVTSHK